MPTPTTGVFKVLAGAISAVEGTWTDGFGASGGTTSITNGEILTAVTTEDVPGTIQLSAELGRYASPRCQVAGGACGFGPTADNYRLILSPDSQTIVLNEGTVDEETFTYAGLPAGFEVTACSVHAILTHGDFRGLNTNIWRVKLDGDTIAEGTADIVLSVTPAEDSWEHVESQGPAFNESVFLGTFGMEFDLDLNAECFGSGFTEGTDFSGTIVAIDQLWLEGTYVLSSSSVRCQDIEVAPGVIASVCDVANTEAEGYDPIDLGTYPQVWWRLGFMWLFQPFSPGPDWTQEATGPEYGWWRSFEEFAGGAMVISTDTGAPRKPRTWEEIPAAYDTGTSNVLGGQGACVVVNNRLIYPRGGYTVDTDKPTIGVFDGISDRTLVSIPDNQDGDTSKVIMSIITANNVPYVLTLDDGTNATNWEGRVFALNAQEATLTPIGARFTGGEVPYAACWHNGRLWLGTNQGDPAAPGKIYWFRPGVDTVWTEDRDLTTDSVGGVTSMASYGGKLYVGTCAASGTFAKIIVRSIDGTYATSLTGTGGTAATNNGFLAMKEFDGDLYASFWNDDATEIAKIHKFDGSSWTTAYTATGTAIKPYVGLYVARNKIYGVGGASDKQVTLIRSTDGALWTDVSAFLPGDEFGIPMFAEINR